MPLPEGKNYVIGKGRVFFDKMLPGTKTLTGERFLGNAPELNDTQDSETLDHFSSVDGINEKDDSVTIEQNQNLTLTVDNIDMENVALWYGGTVDTEVVLDGAPVTDSFAIRKGVTYQLGVTDDSPSGVRKVTDVTLAVVANPGDAPVAVDIEGNVEVDLELARVYLEIDSTELPEGATLEITYTPEAHERKTIIGKGESIHGALRFISNNPHGPQKDQFYPYVKLTANGDYSLITTEWAQMSFNVEVMKRDSATNRVYVDSRPIGSAPTPPEPIPVTSISVEPTSIDFGSVEKGQTASETLIVENTGDTVVEFSANGDSNIMLVPEDGSIAVGDTVEIEVHLLTDFAGTFDGDIEIEFGGVAPATVPFTGNVTETPEVVSISVTPASADMGEVPIGTTGQETLTVENTGNVAVTVTASSDNPSFTVSPVSAVEIAPGDTSAFIVEFEPDTEGVVSGDIEFSYGVGQVESVAVTAEAVQP